MTKDSKDKTTYVVAKLDKEKGNSLTDIVIFEEESPLFLELEQILKEKIPISKPSNKRPSDFKEFLMSEKCRYYPDTKEAREHEGMQIEEYDKVFRNLNDKYKKVEVSFEDIKPATKEESTNSLLNSLKAAREKRNKRGNND